MAIGTLRKVSLRNIAAHKLRLFLTVVAVVLGTAFVSASFMFTNAMSQTFSSAVHNAYRGVDVVASGEINQAQREELAQDPRVERLAISKTQTVVAAREEASKPQPIQTRSGTATLDAWYEPKAVVGNPYQLVEGRAPVGPNEVVLNKEGAENYGIAVGDELTIVAPRERYSVTVTGIIEREVDRAVNLNFLMAEPDYLERHPGPVKTVLIAAVKGDSEELLEEFRRDYPELEFRSGEELADEVAGEIQTNLSFVNYFYVAFGLVALLVGTFLIANTFSMIVAQRTKEFALLRALGASRRQITSSVVLEAIVVGLLGSGLGILVGMGLVTALQAVLRGQNAAMPETGLGLNTQAVLIPLLIGTVVTVISAWSPAQRAGAVEPVEAMRSAESSTPQPLLVRTFIGAVLLATGIATTLMGVFTDEWEMADRAIAVGIGAVALIIGFFLAGPAMSLPLVPTFGRLIGLPFGSVGKLAATNSRRNPRRTSATAFALALGIALITVIGMLGQTMKDSVADLMESDIRADFVVSPPTNGAFPVPADLPQLIAQTEGVHSVVTYGAAPVAVDGVTSLEAGGAAGMSWIMEGFVSDLAVIEMVEGTTYLGNGGFITTEEFAAEHGWKVGEFHELSAPGMLPTTVPVQLVGTYKTNKVLGNMVIAAGSYRQLGLPPGATRVAMVGVLGDGTLSADQLRASLEEALAPTIIMQVMSAEDVSELAVSTINQILAVLYGLLMLAVIIAVLGIINTLTLSVIERRQELGMLRAVGMQRGQVRRMIILESVQISVFGACAGIAIGVFLGWAFLHSIESSGLDMVSTPWGLIGWVMVAAFVVGILAAVMPAVRAARTPPLDAIAD